MDTRQNLVNNSSEIFMKYGFFKTTMDDLARELKISKKTIYKYFSSKEDLINAIIQNLMNLVQTNINRIVSGKENSVLKLLNLSNFFLDLSFRIDNRWISDLKIHNPKAWERIEHFRKETIIFAFNNIIDQGKKENLIVDKPNIIIVTIILSSVQGIINPEFLANNNFSMKEAFIQTFDILISGILTKKGKKLFKLSKQD